MPLQGHPGRVRPAGAARRQERAVPQHGQRHVRGRLRSRRHHARQRHLRPRRQHARLQRRRLGRPVRGERLEPERAVPATTRDGTFKDVAVAAGCAYSQDGKPQAGMGVAVGDYDRNGTVDSSRRTSPATRRRCTRTTARASARIGRSPAASASTRAGSAGASGSSISTTTAGSTCSSSTATSIPRSSAAQDRGRLQAAQGRLSQPRQRPIRGRHASGSARRSRRRRPAAARRSPISTTTATSTSSSTTSTPRRICSGSTRRPSAHWLTLKLVGHDVEPQRDRRARPAVTAGGHAGAGGARRRQLLSRRTICACTSGSGDRQRSSGWTSAGRTALEEAVERRRRSIGSSP